MEKTRYATPMGRDITSVGLVGVRSIVMKASHATDRAGASVGLAGCNGLRGYHEKQRATRPEHSSPLHGDWRR